MDPSAAERLATAHNVWFATVRPSGRPHLVPLWFVWLAEPGRLYVCTGADSVKVRNLAANAAVAVALEDGDSPVIIEGRARRLEAIPPPVAAAFVAKYDWDIRGDDEQTLIEVEPERILAWG